MKHLYPFIFLLWGTSVFAQHRIDPYPLAVTTSKTTSLIFPYGIKSVDHGSPDILVRQATGVDNVLQIKAAKINFLPTSLSVITTDGKFFSFIVTYVQEPAVLNLSFASDTIAQIHGSLINNARADSEAVVMRGQKPFLHTRVFNGNMKLSLQGMYIHQHIAWFVFRLDNHAMIDFIPAYIHFFMEDTHQARRTAMQQEDLTPLYTTGNRTIAGDSSGVLVFAFPQFTIPKGKRLVCAISEASGGRLLLLHMIRRHLLKARPPSPQPVGR